MRKEDDLDRRVASWKKGKVEVLMDRFQECWRRWRCDITHMVWGQTEGFLERCSEIQATACDALELSSSPPGALTVELHTLALQLTQEGPESLVCAEM